MSSTTRKGVTYRAKRKHNSRDHSEATDYKGVSYARPMVVLREREAELNLREQVAELFTQDTSYRAWPRDLSPHARSRFTSQSRDYVYLPAEPVIAEWEISLILKPPAPVIEHVIPRVRRLNTLNVTTTVAQLREAEVQHGPDSTRARMLRERVARERAQALKRESVMRFGYAPALKP